MTKDMAQVFQELAELPSMVAKLQAGSEALTGRIERMLATMPRRLVKIPEAAQHYQVSISTMRRLVREGLIRTVPVGRTVRIDISGSPQLDDLIVERLARRAASRNMKQQKEKANGQTTQETELRKRERLPTDED